MVIKLHRIGFIQIGRLLFAGFILCTPYTAFGEEISLEDAIQKALNASPEVSISKERIYQSQQAILAEKAKIAPQLSLTASAGRTYKDMALHRSENDPNGTDAFMSSSDSLLSMEQYLFDGFIQTSEINKKKTDFLSSKHSAAIVKNDITQKIVNAYLDIYRNQKLLNEVNIFSERLEKLKEKMNIFEKEGSATKTMKKYVSARWTRAQQARVKAENGMKNALETYQFLTNEAFEASNTVYVPTLSALKDLEMYKKELDEENPQIRLEFNTLKSLEYDLKKAYGSLFPSVNLVGEFNETHDNGGLVGKTRQASLMLKMKYKIFDGGERASIKRKTISQLAEQEYLIDRTKRDLNQKLSESWLYIQAKTEEKSLVDSEVRDNTDVRNLREHEFEEGEGDLVQLVEEEENLFNSISKKTLLETELIKKRFELESLFGEIKTERIFHANQTDKAAHTLLVQTEDLTPVYTPEIETTSQTNVASKNISNTTIQQDTPVESFESLAQKEQSEEDTAPEVPKITWSPNTDLIHIGPTSPFSKIFVDMGGTEPQIASSKADLTQPIDGESVNISETEVESVATLKAAPSEGALATTEADVDEKPEISWSPNPSVIHIKPIQPFSDVFTEIEQASQEELELATETAETASQSNSAGITWLPTPQEREAQKILPTAPEVVDINGETPFSSIFEEMQMEKVEVAAQYNAQSQPLDGSPRIEDISNLPFSNLFDEILDQESSATIK